MSRSGKSENARWEISPVSRERARRREVPRGRGVWAIRSAVSSYSKRSTRTAGRVPPWGRYQPSPRGERGIPTRHDLRQAETSLGFLALRARNDKRARASYVSLDPHRSPTVNP